MFVGHTVDVCSLDRYTPFGLSVRLKEKRHVADQLCLRDSFAKHRISYKRNLRRRLRRVDRRTLHTGYGRIRPEEQRKETAPNVKKVLRAKLDGNIGAHQSDIRLFVARQSAYELLET